MTSGDSLPADRHGPGVQRAIRVGGMSKPDLLAELQLHGIEFNDSARMLLAHDALLISDEVAVVETVELAVRDLGFADGATIAQIHERAADLGLSQCPLELGPFLRLQFLDQPEGYWGHPPSQHRAPPGSITVASGELSDDDDFPKGFYLRRIKGVLWLRGYCSGPEHIWSPEDRLVFKSS